MLDPATDYDVSREDIEPLSRAVFLPADERAAVFRRFVAENGVEALIAAFAQFVGLANSVVANQREMIEIIGLVESGESPRLVEQYNLPSIPGALAGVKVACDVEQDRTCEGCAYRLGTCANQSPSTSDDAAYCADDGEQFWCHMEVDDCGKPTQLCHGWAQKSRDARRETG